MKKAIESIKWTFNERELELMVDALKTYHELEKDLSSDDSLTILVLGQAIIQVLNGKEDKDK